MMYFFYLTVPLKARLFSFYKLAGLRLHGGEV